MNERPLREIISHAEKGGPVLTANVRLFRSLRREFDSAMVAWGLGAWPTPPILTLKAWAGRLWDEAQGGWPLLDPVRSKALWERAAREDTAVRGAGTLAATAVADSSWAAYCLMKEYLIRWPSHDIYLTEEARVLKRVSAVYEAELERLGFVDGSAMMERLVRIIEKGGVQLPEEIMVAGFDEPAPAVVRFLDALGKSGVAVRAVGGAEGGGMAEVRVRAYEDDAEEVVQAARWARETAGPGVSIAFVVPELERYRPLIMREFSAELDPAGALVGGPSQETFNISLGAPLAEEPLVASALAFLAIGEGPVEIDELYSALASPYFSGQSAEAASIDAGFRKDGLARASVADVIKRLAQEGSALRARCLAQIAWLRKTREKRLPGQWAEAFSSLLSAVGWTKPVPLSSAEFQALGAWKEALGALSTLDEVAGPVGRAEAASLLRKLCVDRIHQGESPVSSIQVLGLLETAGLSFDHIYMLGCHENALPPAPSPNPFIPVHIQKEHNVPRSSSERELAFSRKLVDRLLSSARTVTVSYPRRDEARDLLISPFFRRFEEDGQAPLIIASSRIKDLSRSSFALEEAPADGPVPVTQDELACVRGGTAIIKDQSHCPFKAFARYRLGAVELEEPTPGLSLMKRGSLIHLALKFFWEELGSQKRLEELKESGGLREFAEKIADRAINEVDLPRPFSTRFLEIEKERLMAVLLDWMDKELLRAPFVVKKVERLEEMDISGLKLRGMIDRVDELEGGGSVMIDYKSGKISSRDWLGERPRDPQLLIYSTSGRFDAVSFALIRPGECRFVGISRRESLLPGVSAYEESPLREGFEGADDWDSLMELWQGVVGSLASGFLSGLAVVDPLGGADNMYGVCRYCGLEPLCRVGATADGDGEGEEADDDRDDE